MEKILERIKRTLPAREELPRVFGVFLVYVVAGKLGLALATVNPSASLFWIPTAIAITSFLLWGYRLWPAIFFGALIVNATTTGIFVTSFFIALGNTLEGLAGAYFVNRWAGGKNVFGKIHNFYRFALYAVIFATMISATIGVTTLLFGGLTTGSDYGEVWFTWWLGDAIGALIFIPVFLFWALEPRLGWRPKKFLEFLALAVALLGVSRIIFSSSFTLSYLIIPILIWLLFRFNPREIATLMAVFSLSTLLGSHYLHAQVFIGIINLAVLPLAIFIYEEKRTKKRLGELALILESADSAVIAKTLDGTVTYWNKGAEKLYGYSEAEAIGKNISMIIPKEKMMEYLKIVENIKEAGRTEYIETTRETENGKIIEISLTNSPIFNESGNVIGISSIAVDITEQKKLELITRQESIKEGERSRKEFITHAAHELRTPLAVLKGNIDVDLKPRAATFSELRGTVGEIDNEIGRISKIISNLIKLSDDEGKARRKHEKIVLVDLIREIVYRYENLPGDITFYLADIPRHYVVSGSRADLTKLFENVIDNAITYKKRKLKISIGAELQDGMIAIKISDNGIGIKKSDLSHIFEQFFRADDARSMGTGAGLGLSVAKSIAEAHGGGVAALSTYGKGSTFIVTLARVE